MEHKTAVEAVKTTVPESTAVASTVCARCGALAEGLPLTWICSVENHERRYFCDDCARRHLRSIEGRLDSARW